MKFSFCFLLHTKICQHFHLLSRIIGGIILTSLTCSSNKLVSELSDFICLFGIFNSLDSCDANRPPCVLISYSSRTMSKKKSPPKITCCPNDCDVINSKTLTAERLEFHCRRLFQGSRIVILFNVMFRLAPSSRTLISNFIESMESPNPYHCSIRV